MHSSLLSVILNDSHCVGRWEKEPGAVFFKCHTVLPNLVKRKTKTIHVHGNYYPITFWTGDGIKVFVPCRTNKDINSRYCQFLDHCIEIVCHERDYSKCLSAPNRHFVYYMTSSKPVERHSIKREEKKIKLESTKAATPTTKTRTKIKTKTRFFFTIITYVFFFIVLIPVPNLL